MTMLYKIASAIVLLTSSLTWGQVNLLENPSFENKLEAWQTVISREAKVTFDVVPNPNKSDQSVLLVTNQSPRQPHVFGRVVQVLNVNPDTRYRMGFRIKAQNASGMIFGGGKGWKVRRDVPSGTYDWQDISFVYTTGPDEKQFMFHIIFEGLSEKVWIDDVFFEDMALIDAANSMKIQHLKASALGTEKFYPAGKVQTIQIDGDLSDWDENTFVTLPGSKQDDLATQLALRYDEQHLYLAITCNDDQHMAYPGADMWVGDSVQFAFAKGDVYGPEYGVTVVDGKAQFWCWQEGSRSLKNDAVNIKFTQSNNTIRYELAIPWAAIYATGKPKDRFKFCLLANDNDGQGRKGWIHWTPGIAVGKDPHNFVDILLTENKPSLLMRTDSAAVVLGSLVPFKAMVFNPMDKPMTGELDLGFVQKTINVPANGMSIISYKRQLKDAGEHIESLELGSLKDICRLEVSGYSKADLFKRLDGVAARLPDLEKLVNQCQAKALACDDQVVDVSTIKKFIPYVREDITKDHFTRASWGIDELIQIYDRADRELKDILAGKLDPKDVPRYVTSKVTADGLAFSAQTVTHADPTPREGPLFFVGYGHFGTAKKDMPIFSDFAANIIQFETGPNRFIKAPRHEGEEFYVDPAGANEIVQLLKTAEKSNVAVCLLLSPHYFPTWALKKYPDLNHYKGGFLKFAINHPMAEKIIKAYLQTVVTIIKDSPALHSICLTNEPVYTDSSQDRFTQQLWADYLQEQHQTVAKLNQIYDANYTAFSQVPIPRFDAPNQTPVYYDWCRFNEQRFSGWHQWMTDIIHAIKPGLPCHAKIMAHPFWASDGVSAQQFATISDYNGCDATWYYPTDGKNPPLTKFLWYEVLTSMANKPVINTEDHVIADRDTRYIPQHAKHIATDLWIGAVAGRGASILWVWERVYNRYHDLSDSILNRPDCVATVGRTALDLNRHVKELKLLQQTPRQVAIVYSDTAAIHDLEYAKSTQSVYEQLVYQGIAPKFVSESQILAGKLADFDYVVLPSTSYLQKQVAGKLHDYGQAGNLICVGQLPKFDQYIRPLEIPFDGFPTELNRITLHRGLESNIQSEHQIWWRVAKDGGDWIVFAVNLGEDSFAARFQYGGKVVDKVLHPRVPQLFRISR
ncbi:MAG TPA: hypothetical protein DER01_20070 [Phycisphaerales bacterium]|nr:hypothetical protein [Phycisphaerales bacterium]|tara:strand:+ start:18202 stop:21618 length:3417 start_codon:yes stop_codon:yes gene_type:complete